jgi:polygalacturonase
MADQNFGQILSDNSDITYDDSNADWTLSKAYATDLSQASVVNIKAPPYRAAGDGVANDTTAFQNAIDGLAGKTGVILVPHGEY